MNSKLPIQDHALEAMPDAEGLLIEDRLWWVRGRKAIIKEYMEHITRYGAISSIMDIGCGSGGNLDVLGGFGRVIGVEPSANLARRARGRGIAESIFQQDALELDECRNVQLFTMFDVLEHIESDKAFLAQLRKKAAHRHFLLVSVPACQFLYSDHDRILHHYRRYTDETLQATLEEGGYQVCKMSYFMFFLFPFVLLARIRDKIMAKLGKIRSTVEIGDFPPILSVPFAATLRGEAFLSQKVRFPIGLWLFALAETNDQSQAPNKPDPGDG
jgi:SAM-dependent methyltransferase